MPSIIPWLPSVRYYLEGLFGEPSDVQLLNGKSGAQVYRVRFAEISLILKKCYSPTEADFYQHIAPLLQLRGITLPSVYVVGRGPAEYWLALEDIPTPLPRDRWYGDHEILNLLARLHNLETYLDLPMINGYTAQWSNDLTDNALACFDGAIAHKLAPRLRVLQSCCQHLFESECWISGDPNPMNWGLRSDVTPVLFDWERFTRATPAIDLAVVSPVFGTVAQYQEVASIYLAQRSQIVQLYPISPESLTRDIIYAKLWTLIEYLSFYTTGRLEPDATLAYLVDELPKWLASSDVASKMG